MRISSKFPVVRQHDISDCAAACLASLLKYYGRSVSIAGLRDLTRTDREGTTGLGIVKAAEKLGFNAKGYKLDGFDQVENEDLPLIAHINNPRHHFVVVYKIRQGVVQLMDPARGIQKMTVESFQRVWTGNVVLIKPNGTGSNQVYKRKYLSSLLLTSLSSEKISAGWVVLLSIGFTTLGIISAFYIRYLFDDVIKKGLPGQITLVTFFFIALYLIQVLLWFLRNLLLVKISLKIGKDLTLTYFYHLLRLPLRFFISRKDGEIVSRFLDAAKIREALSGGALILVNDTFFAIISGVVLFLQNKPLFFVVFLVLVVYGIVVANFRKPLNQMNQLQMESNANLSAYISEGLKGIETLKAVNAMEHLHQETEKKIDVFIGNILTSTRLSSLLTSLTMGVNGIGTMIILWLGTLQVVEGRMTAGELLSFNALLQYFITPVKNLIELQSYTQSALAASERLGEVLEIDPESQPINDSSLNEFSLFTTLKVNHVTFSYGYRKPVLKEVSLLVNPGEKIALVGQSGSGKTTLARLIMNYYQPDSGDIMFGESDVRSLDIRQIRKKIAYLPQSTFLISGTIQENLRLSAPFASETELMAACRLAGCHEWIMELPAGYATFLEENGVNLSGGQRQMLALARAFVQKPDLLILDEATGNLDSITERALENTMNRLWGNVTQIIIARRLSTIKDSDRIYVLDNGRIVESGTHHHLLEQKGLYYEMWKNSLL